MKAFEKTLKSGILTTLTNDELVEKLVLKQGYTEIGTVDVVEPGEVVQVSSIAAELPPVEVEAPPVEEAPKARKPRAKTK